MIPRQLENYREELGWTINRAAQSLGLSRQAYRHLETNAKKVPDSVAMPIITFVQMQRKIEGLKAFHGLDKLRGDVGGCIDSVDKILATLLED